MELIGKLVKDGRDLVGLTREGVWNPSRPEWAPIAAQLNATEHPVRDAQPGDHHLPLGVMSLNRACQRFGGQVVLTKSIQPLPEGAVS